MSSTITKKEKGLNRHWKNFKDKDYLGSHNIEKDEEMVLTICKYEGEENVQTPDGKAMTTQVCQVLYFHEEAPKMILNITNSNMLSHLYGTHPEDWIEKKISIIVANIKAFGKQQDALRIRDIIPSQELDLVECVRKLDEAKNRDELKIVWGSFGPGANNVAPLKKHKDKLKAKFEKDASTK